MDSLAWPLRRLRPSHWIVIDCVITAQLLLVYIELKAAPYMRGIPLWAAIVIVLIAVVPAALRRRWPRAVLALVVVAGAVVTAFSSNPAPPLAAAFVMYLIPLRFARRDALLLLAGTLLVMTAGLAVFAVIPHDPYGPGKIGKAAGLLVEGALLVTFTWLIGYTVRQQRAQAADRREQAERKAREQLAEARRARSEERLQISRELHDVLAHSLSVIAVQAGVASYVIGTRPDEAARALTSIEQTSRGALHEMRALLGVLRDGETGAKNGDTPGSGGAALTPAPGLADLDRLAERAGEAGVLVELSVPEVRPQLPAGLDLAAYRVIQEAVTNVIKHAGTERCRVTVACEDDTLTLEVTDDGGGSAGSDASEAGNSEFLVAGNGIIGMRERAAMYGGEVRAAPLPGRGFRVTARFPLTGTGLADTGLTDTGLAGAGLADTGPGTAK
jgi:signal transduction histidine kinase